MARIRSVHPGQWTDEDFVGCSMAARLLAIAIRNIADDQGAFEWKPLTIKMTCFPADDVNVTELLAELVSSRQVARYEVDGKAYGLIRNFTKYQKPKEPKAVHPLPKSEAVISHEVENTSEVLPKPSAIAPEIVAQREEGGDSLEDGGEGKETITAATASVNGAVAPRPPKYPPDFEMFWEAYPLKVGKGAALAAWQRAKKLVAPDALVRSLDRKWPAEKRFIPHPATFLNERRWEDEIRIAQPANIFEGMEP